MWRLFIFFCGFSAKLTNAFLVIRDVIFHLHHQIKVSRYQVNRALISLLGGSLKITLTVSLREKNSILFRITAIIRIKKEIVYLLMCIIEHVHVPPGQHCGLLLILHQTCRHQEYRPRPFIIFLKKLFVCEKVAYPGGGRFGDSAPSVSVKSLV